MIVGEAHGGSGNGQAGHRVAVLARRLGQVEVPAESRADVSAHSFWKRGTTAIFDIQIVNLDVGSSLRMTLEKDLAKAEKDENDSYLQDCLESIRDFTPMVYSLDREPRVEAMYAKDRLAALLIYKLER